MQAYCLSVWYLSQLQRLLDVSHKLPSLLLRMLKLSSLFNATITNMLIVLT